jgi:hypothetical protein
VLTLVWPALAPGQGSSVDENFVRFARYGADIWAANELAKLSGEGEACISCHTSVPYALVEPLLPGEYRAYTDLLSNIDNRIRTWNENTAWYSETKRRAMEAFGGLPPNALEGLLTGPGSRGPEAIFNALIRATHDSYAGRTAQPETRRAFENLWAEQIRTGPKAGRWQWIEANLIPWEVADSDLWGASLACVASSLYPELAPRESIESLYLSLRDAAESFDTSLHTKAAILWCDSEMNGSVLGEELSGSIVSDILGAQRQDGTWALRELGPWPGWTGSNSDCCAGIETRPDAYSTGFMALALARRATLGRESLEAPLDQAVSWIDKELANPYPSEPRYNRHTTAPVELPEFRNNLSTNAGHMWAFLAKVAHERGRAPWR